MVMANKTGLEILTTMQEGEYGLATMHEVIPMTLVSIEWGRVVLETHADERHLNPMGGVHGGYSATVLDSITGCAVLSTLEAGVGYGTVDLNVKMIRPVPKDEILIAEGKIINVSRTLAISEGILKDKAGKIFSHATSTCKILR